MILLVVSYSSRLVVSNLGPGSDRLDFGLSDGLGARSVIKGALADLGADETKQSEEVEHDVE